MQETAMEEDHESDIYDPDDTDPEKKYKKKLKKDHRNDPKVPYKRQDNL